MARAIEQLKQAMEVCELGALSLPDQIDALMDAGKAVLQEVSTLTPPNEWVSVEERLPEYNPGTGAKSYWVAKKDNAGNWQMKIAQYCDYGYAMTMDAETEVTWRDWDFTKIANVTHWMPLPAPPDRRPPEEET